MTEVQELVVRLRLKDEMSGPIRKVRTGVLGVSDALNHPRMQKGISQVGTGIANAAKIGAIGLALLTTQLVAGLNSLVKLEQAAAQTNAVVKSTGGVAKITAAQVGDMSERFESLNATIGDETVRAGANMLLTFTNIREKAFEPALEAVLNMNTAMGKGPEGLTATAILVGKALNDPIKGLTALSRVGVTFNEGQKEQIKSLIKQGDLFGAQKIILAELDKEFGGSFLAQGDTTAGKVAKFTDSIEDLQRALATALLPTLGRVADKLSEFLMDPAVMKGAEELGEKIAGLFSDKNLEAGGKIFQDVFAAAREAAPAIAAAARVTGEIVGTAVRLFRSLPPELQGLAITALAVNKLTGGLVTNIAGGLIEAVIKRLVSAVVNVNGAVVNVVGAGGLPGGGGPVPVGGGKGGAPAGGAPLFLKLAGLLGIGVLLAEGAVALQDHLDPGRQAEADKHPPAGLARGTRGRLPGGAGPQPVEIVDAPTLNTSGSPDERDVQRAIRDKFDRAAAVAEAIGNRTEGSIETSQERIGAAIDRAKSAVAQASAFATRDAAFTAQTIREFNAGNTAQQALTRQQIAFAIRDLVPPIVTSTTTGAAATAAATRAAGQQTAFAVRDKDLSVAVTTNVYNRFDVDGREVARAISRHRLVAS